MNKAIKTLTLLLMSMLVMSCGVMIHNADDIVNEMRDARHAQYVNVGSGLLGLGKLISPTLGEAGLGINSVQVLDLSKCNGNIRDKYRKHLQNLHKSNYYEEVMTNQHGREHLTVLIRRDGQFANEIVLANASDMTDALVVIQGHISLDNLERIVNDQSRYFNN